MKKLKWVLLALVLALSAGVFAACTEEKADDTFTVTYYDGATKLKTEEVEAGGPATHLGPAGEWNLPTGMWTKG